MSTDIRVELSIRDLFTPAVKRILISLRAFELRKNTKRWMWANKVTKYRDVL